MIYLDANDQHIGYEDVWTKIEMCRAHYASNGLGASYVAEDGAKALDACKRDRVDVPGVAADEGHMLDRGVVRGVEAVVHRRGEPQRHEPDPTPGG